jgi:hypothetical protein
MKILFLSSLAVLCCCTTMGQPKKASNLVADFKTAVDGKWVLASYLDNLAKTKSPLKAQALAGSNVMQLFVDAKRIADKAIYADGWSLHEGGLGFSIHLSPGVKKNTFKTDYRNPDKPGFAFSDIGYEKKEKDFFLVLYHYSKARKLLASTRFIKPDVPAAVSVEKFLGVVVNKTLFAGKYTGTDYLGNTVTPVLTNDGAIRGLPQCTQYEVATFTLETDEWNNYDTIYLADGDDKPIAYAFQFEGNKCLIYKLQKNAKQQLVPGDLQYSLVKN